MSDEEFGYGSDHDVAPTHSKLIEAVAQLDKGQRIKKPERSEPTLEVSEFHLVKSGISNRDVIQVQDLAKNLGEKGFHREISKKLEGNRKKTQILRKPLEKPAADRIKRAVGFEKTQKEVKKWNAVIERNRVADNLQFPLNRGTIKLKPSTEFVKGFRLQSNLEKELAKLEPEKKEEEDDKPDRFAMTMEEIKEKRKEAAKFRAMQSYREAKAARQRRIKSKKFHRVQKKEKMKMQLKEFEELQKINPEAALEKLQLLDKNRALERMSLRHKSTGQWARNKQIRAKYDKDTRQELAEQLSISRDLTQKIKRAGDSEDDDDDDKVPISLSASDKENPWINGVKTQSEINEFVSSYRKYWDQKHKEDEKREKTNAKTTVNVNSTPSDKQNDVEGDKGQELLRPEKPNLENKRFGGKPKNSRCSSAFNPVTEVITEYVNKNVDSNNSVFVVKQKIEKRHENSQADEEVIKTVSKKREKKVSFAIPEDNSETTRNKHKNNTTVEINSLVLPQSNEVNKTEHTETNSTKTKAGNDTVTKNKSTKRVAKQTAGTSVWAVETIDSNTEANESFNDESIDMEEPSMETIESGIKLSGSNVDDINDIFDNLEDHVRGKVQSKLVKVKENYEKIAKKGKRKSQKGEEEQDNAEEDYSDGLKFKNKRQKPTIDEPMLETLGDEESEDEETKMLKLHSLANSLSDAVSKVQTKEAEIDPNKYINVKPQHLMTELPNIVTGGDDVLDDSEGDEDERNHAIISEAFADDDVVEDFAKEKEDEVKKSQPNDIDLTMPGWGSWGGKNLKVSRRKKKRFIIKVPKDQPRKDENKGNVIVIEHKDEKLKEHQVAELPYPFTSVKDFEASIRAPLGRTFVTENAHRRLIEPAVKTAIGQIIEPMDEEVLLKANEEKKNRSLPQKEKKKGKKLPVKEFGRRPPNRKFGNKNFANKKFDNRKFQGNKFQGGKVPGKKPDFAKVRD